MMPQQINDGYLGSETAITLPNIRTTTTSQIDGVIRLVYSPCTPNLQAESSDRVCALQSPYYYNQ